MNRFNCLQSVGEIVAELPEAAKVFRNYGIDFCCGGGRPLSKAAGELNLNEKEILDKLDEVLEETKAGGNIDTDFRALPTAGLIDHIIGVHHAYLKSVLPEIGVLTAKILEVHGGRHKELLKVQMLFNTLKTDLEKHLFGEEKVLFPMILEYTADSSAMLPEKLKKAVKETENEHESAGDILKELERVTDSYKVPEDGCRSFALTYLKLQEMEADLLQHIHLENNILFKRIG